MSRIEKHMDGIIRNVTEELSRGYEEAEALAKAWGGIKYPTKKNGEAFSALAKNFESPEVHVGKKSYAMFDFQKEIGVHTRTAKGAYTTDSIDLYEGLNKYIDHPRADAHPERVVRPSQYLVPFYIESLDEIKEDIANRQAYWEKVAETKKETLEKIETGLTEILNEFGKILDGAEAKYGKEVADIAKRGLRDNYIFF